MGILVYFVAGIAMQHVRYQATGSDLFPNKQFWCSLLPGLVLVRKMKMKVSRVIVIIIIMAI